MSDAAITFSATFLGVFVAFGLTVAYDRRRYAIREREDRRKVLRTIRHELWANLRSLDELRAGLPAPGPAGAEVSGPSGSIQRIVLPHVRLGRSALDTAIHSGMFFLLDGPLLEVVMEQYRLIDEADLFTGQLLAVASAPRDDSSIPIVENLYGAVTIAFDGLRQSLPLAIDEIDRLLA